MKSCQVPKGRENLYDKDKDEKEIGVEDCLAIPLEKNFRDETLEMSSIGPEVTAEEEMNNPSLFQTIDCSGGIISWAEEGIIVTVPPGAILQERHDRTSISTDYTTPLSLPCDFELVSLSQYRY